MQKTMMTKFRPHALCQPKMRPVQEGQTSKKRDDLVYQFKDGQYTLLEVKEIETGEGPGGNTLLCNLISADPRIFPRHEDLDFGLVGVFKDFGNLETEVTLKEKDISGKLIRNRGLILTAPHDVLIER